MSESESGPGSVLSTGERRIAELLREGRSVAEIAEIRGEPADVIERSVDRIREKTDRAVATLLESPYLDEAAADRTPAERERLRAAFDEE
jgi:DNA-binding NarL/FixJ family response regulator